MLIGFFGSCQLEHYKFFLTDEYLKTHNIFVKFALGFYNYDFNYNCRAPILNYDIFDDLDLLIIEINNCNNQASSEKIISYCANKSIKIFKTFLLQCNIYPIHYSGYGINKKDIDNFTNLENIDYISKYNNWILNLYNLCAKSDLNIELIKYIEDNFTKILLFTHSLHPTNNLLIMLYKQISEKLGIEFQTINYDAQVIIFWSNPFTTKLVKDLNITYNCVIDDNFYIQLYRSGLESLKLPKFLFTYDNVYKYLI
jgi:hypothetical protein